MEKTISETRSELAEIMLIHQANPVGNIHGGEIMKLMDNAAGVCAIKHSGCHVVTGRVDELQFHRPIYVGNLVTCTSSIVFAGKSSMEIYVVVEVEDLRCGKPRERALSGYFTMIALDNNGIPTEVPKIKTESDEERALFEQGKMRYEGYKNKK